MALSEQVISDATAYSEEVTGYWKSHLKIIDQKGQLVPLIPNQEQKRLAFMMGLQLVSGLPIRIIGLKARRQGFSTGAEAWIFTHINWFPYLKAMVLAHTADSTSAIFDMSRLFVGELPEAQRRKMERSSAKEIRFAGPHYSSLAFHTAGGKDVGRSKEIHMLHISELAFCEQHARQISGLMQSVSNEVNSLVIKESTACGASGMFYDNWMEAVERVKQYEDMNGYVPVFFSWLEHEGYTMELPYGYEMEKDEDEQALVRLGATIEQLYWRRRIISEKCNGDVDLFKQEYPSTPDEAFQFSGKQVFEPKILAFHESRVSDGKRVTLKRISATKVVAEPWDGNIRTPFWEVWDEPKGEHEYIVAGDVAEGKPVDSLSDKSETDFSTGIVLDRHNKRFVATLRWKGDPDLHGQELIKAGVWYNMAYASPEVNATGMAALAEMRDYPHLFRRDNSTDAVDNMKLSLFGWKTTVQNRDMMIDDYIAAVRPAPITLFDDRLYGYSSHLVSEETTFIRKPSGKREHKNGCHDDLLFAAMIAWQIHKRTPIRGHYEYKRPDVGPLGESLKPEFSFADGRDDLSDMVDPVTEEKLV